MEPERVRDRSVERLLTFADAVVAIAITLLAIPLIDLAGEAAGGFEKFLVAGLQPLLGFTISFFVIARLWWGHHRVFEHVERWTPALVRTLFAWLFAVVLLSAATAVSTAVPPTAQIWTFAVYVGVMILAGGLLLAQGVIVLRHPEITDGRDEGALDRVVGSAETLLGFVITLVVGTAFPVVNYFAFFVLVLTGRLDGPIVRRLQRRADERRPSVR